MDYLLPNSAALKFKSRKCNLSIYKESYNFWTARYFKFYFLEIIEEIELP